MNRSDVIAKWNSLGPRERDNWVLQACLGIRSVAWTTKRDSAWRNRVMKAVEDTLNNHKSPVSSSVWGTDLLTDLLPGPR